MEVKQEEASEEANEPVRESLNATRKLEGTDEVYAKIKQESKTKA